MTGLILAFKSAKSTVLVKVIFGIVITGIFVGTGGVSGVFNNSLKALYFGVAQPASLIGAS
ncbi:hypothetical protein D3C87_1713660 [compost metagenome]